MLIIAFVSFVIIGSFTLLNSNVSSFITNLGGDL